MGKKEKSERYPTCVHVVLLPVCSVALSRPDNVTVLAVSHDQHQYAAAVTSFTGFPTSVTGAPQCGEGMFRHACAADALADVLIETEWKEWIVLTEKNPHGNNRASTVVSTLPHPPPLAMHSVKM